MLGVVGLEIVLRPFAQRLRKISYGRSTLNGRAKVFEQNLKMNVLHVINI